MGKKLRVYELTRELNLDNSEVIRELQHMGVPVTSHSNTVEDRLADQLRKRLGPAADEEPVKAGKTVKVEEPEVEEVVAAPVQEEQQPEAKPVTVPPPPPKIETKPPEQQPAAEARAVPKPVVPPPPAPPAPPAAPVTP